MKFLLIYVPNLRFSFEEDWCTSTIGENFRLSSGLTPSTKEKAYFNNGIIPWINSGELKNKYISFTENKLTLDAVKKHNLTIYPMDTMVIAIYGLEAAGVRGKASITKMDSTISQSCMAFNSLGNVLTQFMYYVYKKEAQILGTRYAQGTKQQNLSSDLLSSYKLLYPSKEEQLKIVNFLSLIDEKIETQSKIIDRLYSQIKYIKGQILNMTTITETKPLGQLCNISTGKRDANEMKSNGSYKFFTCSKDDYCIDTYSFDGEALIISGNGELGLIKYYNGKFDAYQRTYVLQNFKCHPKYLMYVLQNKLPKKIEKEKNVGAMPYIVLKTLTSINIDILNMHDQIKIVNILNKFEEKLENDRILLELFEKEKSFLLKNLFV